MVSNRSAEPVSPTIWTIIELLKWASAYFKSKHIDSPRSTAEILLAHALGRSRIDLYLHHDQPLNKKELTHFKALLRRRIQYEPVAYIIGKKEFWSLNLTVTPEVLIPRPETECLVEQVVGWAKRENDVQKGDLLDLGTGSGAIVLALASELPGWRFWAVDHSPAAIDIARQNAIANDLEDTVSFWVSNWFDAIKNHQQFDVIVSNPPYIPSDQIESLQPEISRFEPRLALDGGNDGLRALSYIIAGAKTILKPGGALLVEIGFDQAQAVIELARQWGAYRQIELFQDYSNRDRVVRMVAQ